VIITVVDAAGNTSTPTTVTVGGTLPPDPTTVAPPLDPTVATTLGTATAFLYAGPSPVQTGVAPGTINPVRAAVLRGRVLDANGTPLPGVTLTVLNHPEFGQTLSRADGMFDLAINGGGFLTVTPDGTHIDTLRSTNGTTTTTFPDGLVATLIQGPDSWFNMQAPLPASVTIITGGLTENLTLSRTVALADSKNPLYL
jgi:hypothetical protein